LFVYVTKLKIVRVVLTRGHSSGRVFGANLFSSPTL